MAADTNMKTDPFYNLKMFYSPSFNVKKNGMTFLLLALFFYVWVVKGMHCSEPSRHIALKKGHRAMGYFVISHSTFVFTTHYIQNKCLHKSGQLGKVEEKSKGNVWYLHRTISCHPMEEPYQENVTWPRWQSMVNWVRNHIYWLSPFSQKRLTFNPAPKTKASKMCSLTAGFKRHGYTVSFHMHSEYCDFILHDTRCEKLAEKKPGTIFFTRLSVQQCKKKMLAWAQVKMCFSHSQPLFQLSWTNPLWHCDPQVSTHRLAQASGPSHDMVGVLVTSFFRMAAPASNLGESFVCFGEAVIGLTSFF